MKTIEMTFLPKPIENFLEGVCITNGNGGVFIASTKPVTADNFELYFMDEEAEMFKISVDDLDFYNVEIGDNDYKIIDIKGSCIERNRLPMSVCEMLDKAINARKEVQQ